MAELRAFYKLEKELRMQIISRFLPDYHRIHPENVLAKDVKLLFFIFF